MKFVSVKTGLLQWVYLQLALYSVLSISEPFCLTQHKMECLFKRNVSVPYLYVCKVYFDQILLPLKTVIYEMFDNK